MILYCNIIVKSSFLKIEYSFENRISYQFSCQISLLFQVIKMLYTKANFEKGMIIRWQYFFTDKSENLKASFNFFNLIFYLKYLVFIAKFNKVVNFENKSTKVYLF